MSLSHSGILLGVGAAAFLGPFSQTAYAPSLPELGSFFAVNTVLVNLTISLFMAILALATLLVGPMADRWGRRAMLLPGLLLFTLGSLLCLFAASYWIFLGGRMVQAIGISTAIVIAPTVIGDVFPQQERVAAIGLYQALTFLGPVLGPVVGGLIAAHLQWQWVFALLAAGGLAAWFYNRKHLPETLPAGLVPVPIRLRSFRSVLANRSAVAVLMLGFSQFFGYYVFLVFLPTLLATLYPQQAASTGFFFLPLTAGILAAISLSGRFARRWRRSHVVGAATFGIAGSVLLFWLALSAGLMSLPLLLVFLLAYGLLLGASLPVQTTILVSLFHEEKATAVGSYNFCRFAGAACGPLVGGLISLAYGVDTVFLVLGVLLLAAAWVVKRQLTDALELP